MLEPLSQPLAMLLSIAVEAAIAAAWIRVLGWGSALRAAVAATLGTMLTHWFAWHGAPIAMAAIGDAKGFVAVEAAVTIIEAAVYWYVVPLSPLRALVTSLAANGGSAAVGVVLAAFNVLAPS